MATTDPLLPSTDEPDSAPFWKGCLEGKLLVQKCADCEALRNPPRPMCPSCQSTESTWQEMSGRATIWSYIVPHPPVLPAYEALAPYNVIVVALDEDPTLRFVGNLLATPDGEINEIDPLSIVIGESVQVVFQQASEDVAFPRWVRA